MKIAAINQPNTQHYDIRKVDYLLDKPIEIIKRLNKSKHLNKFFKQRADKVSLIILFIILAYSNAISFRFV